jgi:hypothetical protein
MKHLILLTSLLAASVAFAQDGFPSKAFSHALASVTKESKIITSPGASAPPPARVSQFNVPVHRITDADHFYSEIQLGFGGMQTKTGNGANTPDFIFRKSQDNSRTAAYRLSVGYLYSIKPYFELGPELGYEKYGDNAYTTASTSSPEQKTTYVYQGHSIDLLANALYQFNPQFYAMAKLGVSVVRQTSHAFQAATRVTKKVLQPKLGLGIGYSFNFHVALDATANATYGKFATFNSPHANDVARTLTFLLGAKYTF